MRPDSRNNDMLRKVEIQMQFTKYAAGSVLISVGDTKVICTATLEERVPGFLKGKGEGWLTAEYSMLPSATHQRTDRERFKVGGRTMEIQRLIGRSLRSIVDLSKLGERTITIDCDVIQADGGTRTASITGAYVALKVAVETLLSKKVLSENPVMENVAAVSVGIVDGEPRLDLMYEEDSTAEVDLNIIMTSAHQLVEIQGTAEKKTFSKEELAQLLSLGEKGIKELIELQNRALQLVNIKA